MKTQIITIGRQFGAKGRSIGKKIADELGIGFYDKELIAEAAKQSGLSEKILHNFDETSSTSLLYSIVMNAQSKNLFGGGKSVEQLAYEAQIESVKNVAKAGSCVIVGRAADAILADEYDVFSIFITAPMKDRIAHVAERDEISEKEAESKIIRLDRARASFYNGVANKKWGKPPTTTFALTVGMFRKNLQ